MYSTISTVKLVQYNGAHVHVRAYVHVRVCIHVPDEKIDFLQLCKFVHNKSVN